MANPDVRGIHTRYATSFRPITQHHCHERFVCFHPLMCERKHHLQKEGTLPEFHPLVNQDIEGDPG